MDARKQAQLMVKKFNPHVYCYCGSGYLTGTESPEVIHEKSKKCALIACEWLINESKSSDFYKEVKKEIEAMKYGN